MVHKVKFTVPSRELGNADIRFDVFSGSAKFGTLQISKGSIAWFPRSDKKARRMSWSDLDEAMMTVRKSNRRR